MDLGNGTTDEYLVALKKLLPQGSYWDKILENANGDVPLVLSARAESLAAFKKRMNDALLESYPDFATETLEDWERIYLDSTNEGLAADSRRTLLRGRRAGGVNIAILRAIAEAYGATIKSVEFPYTPAMFARTQFGLSFMSPPAGLWVAFIYAICADENRDKFESAVRQAMLAHQVLFFVYGD